MSAANEAFIKKYGQAVINATAGTGILPSIAMAQMLIESAGKYRGPWRPGGGITAVLANNYFGIKADKNWKGRKMAFQTPKDGKPSNFFRVYPSVQDSIKDHTKFFLDNSRYKSAGLFKAQTPKDQANALDRSKYSESPTYGKGLMKIVDAYHLDTLLDGKKAKSSLTWLYVTGGIVFATGGALYIDHKYNKGAITKKIVRTFHRQ